MAQGFSNYNMNYNNLSLEELLIIKKDLSLNLQIIEDKLYEINKTIEDKQKIEKPRPIELGVDSINSEEVVKFR